MDRRNFLKNTLFSTALASTGGLPALSGVAHASSFAPVMQRTLVNIKLDGGPDFRHLFAPAFNASPSSFGHQFWSAVGQAHSIAGNAFAWERRWNDDYTPLGSGEFGILSSCDWLRRMWDAGNVALVSNVLGSPSRNHALASMILDQGNRSSGRTDVNRSGWGGRLAAETGSNVIALTHTPRAFCYGPDPTDPDGRSIDQLISAQNVRAMKLYEPPEGTLEFAAPATITRALRGYYAAKREEIHKQSAFRRLFDMERQLREFSVPIQERLQSLPVPAEIERLYDGATAALDSPYFGMQMRNLYDAIALNDVFGMRIASLEYQGFDTHEEQSTELEVRLRDLFGTNMALESLWQSLPADARANTVFVLAGEFGRQIRANGDGGTDHGEGAYVMLIGEPVNGGIYGDMYPEAELARLADPSPQIEGLTAIEHVFGRICDWMQPGAGDAVFPTRATAPMESGLNLTGLLG